MKTKEMRAKKLPAGPRDGLGNSDELNVSTTCISVIYGVVVVLAVVEVIVVSKFDPSSLQIF